MIWESHIWKDELSKDLESVKRVIIQVSSLYETDSFERTLVSLERFAFTSAFIIR